MRSLLPTLLACSFGPGAAAQQYDLRVFTVDEGLPGGAINALAQDSAGRLWVDCEGGLCSFDGRRFVMADSGAAPPGEVHATWIDARRSYSLLPPATGLATMGLTHAERTVRDGTTWLGTVDGIEVITPQGIRLITEANGLGGNDVRCLLEDRSGTIWIGTSIGGLTRYNGPAFTHFTERDGLNARMVTAMHRTADGLLWFGTNNGFVSYWDGTRVVSAGQTGGSYPTVRSIMDDANGLLIGTDQGLLRMNTVTGRVEVLTKDDAVNDVLRRSGGSILLATDRGSLVLSPDGDTERIGPTIRANALLSAGSAIAIGTADGLLFLDSAATRTAGHELKGIEITSLARDRSGNTWLGTRGKGVARWRNDGPRWYTEADGLASNDIEQVLLDAFDNLWIGTRRGFDHLELDELQEEVVDVTHYGKEDGFISSEALRNACLLDADSTLWFGTSHGATHFAPQRLAHDPDPLVTRITGILLDHEAAALAQWCDSIGRDGLPVGLRLPHDRDHLTFLFEAVSPAYPDKVRYQYKLEGLEDDWSPITSTDRVVHSALQPGEYTFLVIARNASGVWSDPPVRLSFTIEPPFHRTTAFRAGSALALVSLFFGFTRLRERRARLERERLAGLVKARTRELEEEKDRSERLLLNILPETTAAELKERGSTEARSYPDCTVLFSDFQGFTSISEQMEAHGIVAELDRFFRAFDRIMESHGMEKIKTIGDAYMCAAGVPQPRNDHALVAVRTALEMVHAVENINAERAAEGKAPWPIRIGLHSGPLVAGVVGEKKFAYDIWGGTVNLASRMESNGAAGKINISGATYARVMHKVRCTPRGPINVKGKGEVQMYFVEGWKEERVKE